ncbi:MAG: ABC transporter ATP-binding protein [Peptococcaceae bacterium]|nr:ABC transporter ATP-binding protein [Peptococcaceae bacterium]
MRMLFLYVWNLYNFCRFRFLLNIVLMIVLGLLEGIGILLIIPLLILAGIIPGMQATSGIAFWFKQLFQHAGIPLNLLVVLAIYTAVNVGQSWLKRYQTILNADIQQAFGVYLGIRLFRAVAHARWQTIMCMAKSDITNVMIMELMRVYSGINYFLQTVAAVFIALIQVAIALMVSPGLTALVIGGAVILFVLLRPLMRESHKVGKEISNLNTELVSALTEQLGGLKEVKSYGMESVQIDNFANTRNMIKDNLIKFNLIQTGTSMYYNIGAAVFISLCLLAAVDVFRLDTQQFILITYVSARLWPRLSSFQSTVQNILMVLPGFKAARDLEEQCLAAQEEAPEEGAATRMELARGVEFSHVTFFYDKERSSYAVQDADFFLPANSTTALVGVSGAGKSTVVDLLMGLLSPGTGRILLDGRPLAENLRAWRNSIGYVPQDPFLFNASIRDNLLWSSPDAPEEEIWAALRSASVDSFVRSLPAGIDTVVGDRGVRLSGGERQRIVLARALLRRPSILVLDEATSSLDSENERRIKLAIEGLRGKLTIVVVAHRISTIRNVDRIFVLEDGRVVEQGDYDTLMEDQNSRFYALAC